MLHIKGVGLRGKKYFTPHANFLCLELFSRKLMKFDLSFN
jgi:hypothetical protein